MAINAATPGKIKSTSITTPQASGDNHTLVLGQLKETTEIAQRLRGDPNDSFVRVSEINSALGTRMVNNTLQPPMTAAAAASGVVNVTNSITGTGVIAAPLQLVGDSATPGNSFYYGTNASGVKSYYALPSSGSSPLTTKGDLFGHSTVDVRVPVGTNGQVLTADSTATPGVSWQTPSGGSGSANITPDTHVSGVPAFLSNDESEGPSLDTTGSRFAGAIPWTWQQQNSATISLKDGAANWTAQFVATNTINAIVQPLSGSSWRFRSKATCYCPAANHFAGPFYLRESATDKVVAFGLFNSATTLQIVIATGTLSAGFTAVPSTVNIASNFFPASFLGLAAGPPIYFEIELASGNLLYRVSATGYDGSFHQIFTVPVTTEFTTAPNQIGSCVRADTITTGMGMWVDWWRQEA